MNSTALAALRCVILVSFLACVPPVGAIDTAVIEGGFSDDADAERYGGSLRWNLGGNWWRTGNWSIASYVELSLAYWDGKPGTTGEDDLFDFGLTPVLRWQRDPGQGGIAPFVEVGVGAHGHTEDGIGDEDFDIPFAFGSHVGGGVRFGAAGRYELVYRYQHLSNAGLGDENPGINFHVFQFGYHF